VIVLFVTAQPGERTLSSFELWRRLGPPFSVLSWSELAVERIVAKIPLAETMDEKREGEAG
jgi:hypothetical protein